MFVFFVSLREWRDGLFTSLLRKLCLVHNTDFTNSKPIMKTLHLDGGIDPAQMEIFSSVFHSDGALVLANNERIHVPDNLRIFWEVRMGFLKSCDFYRESIRAISVVWLV